MKNNVTKTLLSLSIVLMSFGWSNAQTLAELNDKYNELTPIANEEPAKAMAGYNEILKACEALDGGCEELLGMIGKKMPVLAYKAAVKKYKAKDYAGSITAFEEAIKVSEQYENEAIATKAKKVIPSAYYAQGKTLKKEDDFDGAIAALDKSLEMRPKYAKAHYELGSIYRKKKEYAKSEENLLAAIEHATEKEAKIVTASKKTLLAVYISQTKKSNSAKDFAGAIAMADKAAEYAAGNAEKEAQLEYLKAKAYKGQGNTGSACAAYKACLAKAPNGPYAETAQYAIKNELKCN